MTRLYITSDTHDREFPNFDERKYDAVIHCGDITNTGFGKIEGLFSTHKTIEYISNLKIPFYWIPGNHDIGFDLNPPWDNNLLRTIHKIEDYTVIGASLSPCYNYPTLAKLWSHMTSNKKAEEIYYETLPKADIVVSHCPPAGCDDMDTCSLTGRKNLGSQGLRKYIIKHEPKYVLCGHIHKKDRPYERYIGNTLVINLATVSKELVL